MSLSLYFHRIYITIFIILILTDLESIEIFLSMSILLRNVSLLLHFMTYLLMMHQVLSKGSEEFLSCDFLSCELDHK